MIRSADDATARAAGTRPLNSSGRTVRLAATWILLGLPAALPPASLAQTDLQAGALHLATDANTSRAMFSYAVVGADAPLVFQIAFGLDRDGDGAPEQVLTTLPGMRAAGLHTVSPDLRIPLNSAAYGHGDALVAVLDFTGVITEPSESNNVATSALVVDLVVNSFTLNPSESSAAVTLNYTVSAPAGVLAEIRYWFDRDADGTPEVMLFGESTQRIGPGTYTVTRELRTQLDAQRPARSGTIVARLDDANHLFEQNEGNNSASAPFSVDVRAHTVAVLPNATDVQVVYTYTIASIAMSTGFQLALGLDTDNDGLIDRPGPMLSPNLLVPGTHTGVFNARGFLDSVRVRNGDRLLFVVDSSERLIETSETNNVAMSAALMVDLVATGFVLDAAGVLHTSWFASAPAATESFQTNVYLDSGNGQGGPPDGRLQMTGSPPDRIVRQFTGGGLAGPRSFSSALAPANRPAVGQPLFLVVDAVGQLAESNEQNNQLVFVRPAPACGDLNCDGVVSAEDIDPFVVALLGRQIYASAYPGCCHELADINGDGLVNNFDIEGFVALLAG
ncbi:MAG: hypothetical protein AB7Q17_11320 [Phycisphaerae bacterium]